MLGQDFTSLSDDELFEKITHLRKLRGHRVSQNYETMGDSISGLLSEMEEEWQIRLFKQSYQLKNQTINLGSLSNEDDIEL